MTDALAQRSLARVAWYEDDAHLYGYVKYAFAIEGAVDLIIFYPGQWSGGDGPHVASEQTCAGTFVATTFLCPINGRTIPTVRLEGCGP